MADQHTIEPIEGAARQPVDDYQREADFLAALLEHPDIPADYCGYIEDLVLELANTTALFTPAVLRAAWPLIRREPGNGGAGVFRAISMALKAFSDEEADAAMNEIAKQLYEGRYTPPGGESWPEVISKEVN